LEDRVITAIRNIAALPLMLAALMLWWISDALGRLSQLAGDAAEAIMAPDR
jgi:hypothetical protein